jgi:hypothetical protein
MGALAWDLVQLCPAEPGGPTRRALKSQATSAPYEAIEVLAHRMSAEPFVPWSEDIFRAAEVLLATGDAVAVELVTFGLLEDLGNIASHSDTPTSGDDFLRRLPPLCSAAWQLVDDLWLAAATQRDTSAVLFAAKYEGLSNPALRATVQCMFRRMGDEQFVGLADVLRYEAAHGGGPHIGKAG